MAACICLASLVGLVVLDLVSKSPTHRTNQAQHSAASQ